MNLKKSTDMLLVQLAADTSLLGLRNQTETAPTKTKYPLYPLYTRGDLYGAQGGGSPFVKIPAHFSLIFLFKVH